MAKAKGNYLIKSTSLEKTQSPVSGFAMLDVKYMTQYNTRLFSVQLTIPSFKDFGLINKLPLCLSGAAAVATIFGSSLAKGIEAIITIS